ncbi:MAG: SMC-Scp complex subunit ScpB, partial [Gammaproteobacteria bacterium]
TYRQPITRGEIEDVRGVSVSSSTVKTLLEREWIRVLGHREVPGRPALFGTTSKFLDDFGLRSLEALPPLNEIKDIENLGADLFSDLSPVAGAEIANVAGAVETDAAELEGAGSQSAQVLELESARGEASEQHLSQDSGETDAAIETADAAANAGADLDATAAQATEEAGVKTPRRSAGGDA